MGSPKAYSNGINKFFPHFVGQILLVSFPIQIPIGGMQPMFITMTLLIFFLKIKYTWCLYVSGNHRAAVFYFKMHFFFFFFHLNTFNSNTVCSYKGFSPQIYALLVTTLLPSAVNSIQKKNPTKSHVPWLHSEPKKKSIIKKQVCYTEFWAALISAVHSHPHWTVNSWAHTQNIQWQDFKS